MKIEIYLDEKQSDSESRCKIIDELIVMQESNSAMREVRITDGPSKVERAIEALAKYIGRYWFGLTITGLLVAAFL